MDAAAVIMLLVRTNENKAAAAARIGARRALRERSALLEALKPCFARTQTWLRAGKMDINVTVACASCHPALA